MNSKNRHDGGFILVFLNLFFSINVYFIFYLVFMFMFKANNLKD